MKRMSKLLFIILPVFQGQVWATDVAANLTVSAQVLSVCAVLPGLLDFGTYSGSQKDISGSFDVTCTVGTTYDIALGPGLTGTIANRLMTSGINNLPYQLYTDSGYGTVWGDGTGTSSIVSGTGTGVPVTHDVFGRILAGQTLNIGVYADTVLITVTY